MRVQHLLPVRVFHIAEIGAQEVAGIVDDDMQPVAGALHGGDQAVHIGLGRDIGAHAFGLAAGSDHLGGGSFDGNRIEVAHEQARAFGRKQFGHGEA
jgi:hypothetical protein